MSDKCYRVEFTAHLHRLTLALKMSCDIEVMWKRGITFNHAGEKVCESGKVELKGGEARFDRKISINCNMIYNTKTNVFKEKIVNDQSIIDKIFSHPHQLKRHKTSRIDSL